MGVYRTPDERFQGPPGYSFEPRYVAKMLEVRAELERWEKPTLVLFSDSDPIFSTVAAEHMASRIPGAGPAETVARAGHFVQEERGEEIAERIAGWVTVTAR